MNRKFFVSYRWVSGSDNEFGFGNIQMDVFPGREALALVNIPVIREWEQRIEKAGGYSKVVIMNYQELE